MPDIRGWFQTELGYVVLLFLLFVAPRLLQRWRLPTAVTAFGMGAVASLGFHLFGEDPTIHLLALFGIVALFLFAGLEVDLPELRQESRILSQHLALRVLLLVLVTWVVTRTLSLPVRPAALVALALVTPSTGFILDSIGKFGLNREERFWVKTKAIATELLALAVLFFTLQSASPEQLVLSTAALVGLIIVLPVIFRFFAQRVAPLAPKSEFAFLLMMALLCAYATRQLGVYYLVGAFIVGIAARRFREQLPAMASEQMLHAVEVFASFFVPFYFFSAGLGLQRADFSLPAVALGIIFFAVMIPVLVATVALQRRVALGEAFSRSFRVAVPMLPTLVFTLVIAEILRSEFNLEPMIFGGLIVYTMLNTVLPGVLLHAPVPEFDTPELPPADDAGGTAISAEIPVTPGPAGGE